MQAINDEDILQWLKTPGSQEKGFRALVAKYSERLYWHIRKMVVDHEDANDVLQNTFIKTYRGIGNFKGDSALYTWLYRIASNEGLTHLKKKQRKQTMDIDDETLHLDNRLKSSTYFEGDQVQHVLQLAIATLPEKQRVVFNLRYFENMKYDDMSEVLETSVGALKASYHHAKSKIETFVKNNVQW